MKRNHILIIVEILVMGGIVFGWFAPLLFSAGEEENSQRGDVSFFLTQRYAEVFREVRGGF